MDFVQMQEMQRALQEKYQDKWTPLTPETAVRTILWMIGEVSEVADILKKRGESAVMEDAETRADFVEELCDVLMYFNDAMLCFDITPEELEAAYRKKHERNMKRW